MMGWLRVFVLLFVVLTIAYVVLWFRAQARAKARLKAHYAESDKRENERDYVATGLEKFNRGLKPKLLLVVYFFPIIITAFLIYLANS